MKEVKHFETSVTIYQPTWSNIPEDLNRQQQRCENLTSRKRNYPARTATRDSHREKINKYRPVLTHVNNSRWLGLCGSAIYTYRGNITHKSFASPLCNSTPRCEGYTNASWRRLRKPTQPGHRRCVLSSIIIIKMGSSDKLHLHSKSNVNYNTLTVKQSPSTFIFRLFFSNTIYTVRSGWALFVSAVFPLLSQTSVLIISEKLLSLLISDQRGQTYCR